MKGFLILIALSVLGTNAIPKPLVKQGRVGAGVAPEHAPHACMVLVNRQELNGTNTAALGGGSIISTRHVLTAAHLVQGDNINYQVGFIVGTSRRMFTSTFRVIHENYNNSDFSSDLALIFLQGTNTFPLASVIRISADIAAPADGDAGKVVGFGFTLPNSTQASSDPYQADQTVAADCVFDNFEQTDTHFCAADTVTIICPGDNGCGFFTGDTTGADDSPHILLGIVSRVLSGCETPANTLYTQVSQFSDWISNITGVPIEALMQYYNVQPQKLY
jgi:secreted trypsin-like serine protease